MDRREALEAEAAEQGVAVPGHEDYDTWRNVTDFAVGRCEELLGAPGNYGIHLDCIALREESLGSALSRAREERVARLYMRIADCSVPIFPYFLN